MSTSPLRPPIVQGTLATLPRTRRVPLAPRYSVLGMGRTGISVACFLASRGVDVLASDSRTSLEPHTRALLSTAGVELSLGGNEVRGGDVVVISPGIRPGSRAFQDAHVRGAEVISEPELFARLFDGPIVAVTGTDGKSTVTTWIEHLLKLSGIGAMAGGNLGNPLIENVEDPGLEVGVLEISAFQLITTHSLVPAVALVTNLSEDHLDHFGGDESAYAAAKRRLVDLCIPQSTLFRADSEREILNWSRAGGGVSHRYGGMQGSGAWFEGDGIWISTEEHGPVQVGRRSELQLVGIHNAVNAVGAAGAAYAAGAEIEAIREGLGSYSGLPHRCVVVRTRRGVRWINDSKATTPNATAAALTGLDAPVVLIAGGSEKGVDYRGLGALLRQHASRLLLIGETADALEEAVGPLHPVERFPSLEAAVERADALTESGETVLLSPASASFDMFESYAARGERFESLVRALPE